MKFLVFGSLNIDKTYAVDAFVKAGQTISARRMDEYCGGKGFNQAIALRRAGNEVYFAGAVGRDGQMLLDSLDRNGIDRRFVRQTQGATGHAIIQLDAMGQNCIIILAGANGEITEADADRTLAHFGPGDLVVLQNEITCVPYIMQRARERGMIVAFNPAPCDERIGACSMENVDYLLLNETEGAAMTGESVPAAMLDVLRCRYPRLNTVLTLGSDGSLYQGSDGQRLACGILQTEVADTTAAGDTFTGYFLSGILRHGDPASALRQAACAAGIAVSRKGAEPSVPFAAEVDGQRVQCESGN